MRYPVKETAAKHERIVEDSRLFRERGFENVTVGEVMKAAGLTHGAFYAHFGSKQELQEAAVAYGQGLSAGRVRSHGATRQGRRAYGERYLGQRHRDNPGDGCTMAALAQEVVRSTPELKTASSEDSRKFSPQAGGTEKKEFFKQPRCSAGSCWLALCKIRDSRRKSLGAFNKSSADRALAKCECHSCDLEANRFVDGSQSRTELYFRGYFRIGGDPDGTPEFAFQALDSRLGGDSANLDQVW